MSYTYSVLNGVKFWIFIHGFHPLCALVFPLKIYFCSLLPWWILILILFCLNPFHRRRPGSGSFSFLRQGPVFLCAQLWSVHDFFAHEFLAAVQVLGGVFLEPFFCPRASAPRSWVPLGSLHFFDGLISISFPCGGSLVFAASSLHSSLVLPSLVLRSDMQIRQPCCVSCT
jgi:hypothetical protein